jgi:hypothetical protein
VRAERFRPLVPIGDSDYDRLFSGADGSAEAGASGSDSNGNGNMTPEELDQFSLRTLLADFMHMDPGMRYQLARNAFERALVDAKARNDIGMLLADNECSAVMQEEAKSLLTQTPTRATNARLFELFLQREDMLAFSHDFAEMKAYLGPDGPAEGALVASASAASDPYDWSRFQITDGAELRALQVEMAEADARALAGSSGSRARGLLKSIGGSTLPEGSMPSSSSSVGGKGLLLVDGTGDEEPVAVSLEDPSSLMDRDGRMWSGAILDTDMVQKTMPGNRVNSHRALVVVGNMRGAAGFGMGKGKTTGDAVNAAFRCVGLALSSLPLSFSPPRLSHLFFFFFFFFPPHLISLSLSLPTKQQRRPSALGAHRSLRQLWPRPRPSRPPQLVPRLHSRHAPLSRHRGLSLCYGCSHALRSGLCLG